jgi:hypothetical protein
VVALVTRPMLSNVKLIRPSGIAHLRQPATKIVRASYDLVRGAGGQIKLTPQVPSQDFTSGPAAPLSLFSDKIPIGSFIQCESQFARATVHIQNTVPGAFWRRLLVILRHHSRNQNDIASI